MGESDEKLAANEAAFRAANEKLETFASENLDDPADGLLPFLCECDRMDCTQVVLVTLPEYERVRLDGRQSVMVKGHNNPDIEQVLEETDRFTVTKKFGVAAEVYDDLDPRS